MFGNQLLWAFWFLPSVQGVWEHPFAVPGFSFHKGLARREIHFLLKDLNLAQLIHQGTLIMFNYSRTTSFKFWVSSTFSWGSIIPVKKMFTTTLLYPNLLFHDFDGRRLGFGFLRAPPSSKNLQLMHVHNNIGIALNSFQPRFSPSD